MPRLVLGRPSVIMPGAAVRIPYKAFWSQVFYDFLQFLNNLLTGGVRQPGWAERGPQKTRILNGIRVLCCFYTVIVHKPRVYEPRC
jgi:hypothetical protein